MKYLLLALCLPLAAAAQQPATQPALPAPTAPTYRYCALLVRDRYFNAPSGPYLDYGQDAPGAVADPEMAEMAKNIGQSGSIIDMLNYLGRHHWELLTVTPVSLGLSSTSTGTSNIGNAYTLSSTAAYETRYLLRRLNPLATP